MQEKQVKYKRTIPTYARQVRTFGQSISKKDIKKFPELEKYNGKDITYIIYESLEIQS
jgi:hypothetical protein